MFRKGLRAVFAEASLVRKAKSKGEPFRGWKNTRAHLNRDNGIVFDDVAKSLSPRGEGLFALREGGGEGEEEDRATSSRAGGVFILRRCRDQTDALTVADESIEPSNAYLHLYEVCNLSTCIEP